METKKDIREEKIDACCGPATTVKAEASSGDHDHDHDHDHSHSHEHATRLPAWREHLDLLSALAIVIILLTLEFAFSVTLPRTVSFAINAVAYLLAGWNVLRMAFRKLSRAEWFPPLQ